MEHLPPFVGASDIGQESAYTCKLPELPPGTSKGLLHFVQYKGSTQVIQYNFSENNIQDMVRNPPVPQKEIFRISCLPRKLLDGQFLQVGLRRNSLATVPKISPKSHQLHISFFVHDLSCKSCIPLC